MTTRAVIPISMTYPGPDLGHQWQT